MYHCHRVTDTGSTVSLTKDTNSTVHLAIGTGSTVHLNIDRGSNLQLIIETNPTVNLTIGTGPTVQLTIYTGSKVQGAEEWEAHCINSNGNGTYDIYFRNFLRPIFVIMMLTAEYVIRFRIYLLLYKPKK